MLKVRSTSLLSAIFILLALQGPQVFARDGGQDGGGGSTYKSSSKQVFEAIQKAMEMAADPTLHQRAVQIENIDSATTALVTLVIHPKMAGAKTTADKWFGPAETLDMSRILIRDSHPEGYSLTPPFFQSGTGSCPSNHGDVDASVSKNELGADICFSIDNLRVHSPQAILKEVFALLFHELAHVAGYGEDEANVIQQFYLDNYDEITNHARRAARQEILFQQVGLVTEIEIINGYRLENSKWEMFEGYGAAQTEALLLARQMRSNTEHTWAFDVDSSERQAKSYDELATKIKIAMKLSMYEKLTPEQGLAKLEEIYEEAQRNCYEIYKTMKNEQGNDFRGCDGKILQLPSAAN